MMRVLLKPYSGQLGTAKVVQRLRGKIQANLRMRQCVLLDMEGAHSLDENGLKQLLEGWPPDRVRILCAGRWSVLPPGHEVPPPPSPLPISGVVA